MKGTITFVDSRNQKEKTLNDAIRERDKVINLKEEKKKIMLNPQFSTKTDNCGYARTFLTIKNKN